MLKKALYALALISLLWASPAIALECGSIEQHLKAAIEAGFTPAFTSKTDKGMTIIALVDRQGIWVLLGVDRDGYACPVAVGYDFIEMLGRDA